MKHHEERYQMNRELFMKTRRERPASLRDVSEETGVDHTAIHRFEKNRNITARHYVALMMWVVMNAKNIH